jgi:cytochrome c oxidase subunit 2
VRRFAPLLLALGLAACGVEQSALAPTGHEAEHIARLFWIMTTGGAVIWAAVVGLAIYASRIRPGPHRRSTVSWLILGGGVAFPVCVLAALLVYGVLLMPELRDGEARLRIEVVGEQWWWRVHYWLPAADAPVVGANEVVLPVGERVEFVLSSPDVIHSFWIPPLAGKLDMIPGRVTRFTVQANEPGLYRGQCAEFCGESHALMAFAVRALEPAEFETWLTARAEPAGTAEASVVRRGQTAFLAAGCGACHTIRGTAAAGVIGPDLTHVGSRATLAAGTLPNDPESMRRWIAAPDVIKPGVRMPAFGMLPDEMIADIAAYLESLK